MHQVSVKRMVLVFSKMFFSKMVFSKMVFSKYYLVGADHSWLLGIIENGHILKAKKSRLSAKLTAYCPKRHPDCHLEDCQRRCTSVLLLLLSKSQLESKVASQACLARSPPSPVSDPVCLDSPPPHCTVHNCRFIHHCKWISLLHAPLLHNSPFII